MKTQLKRELLTEFNFIHLKNVEFKENSAIALDLLLRHIFFKSKVTIGADSVNDINDSCFKNLERMLDLYKELVIMMNFYCYKNMTIDIIQDRNKKKIELIINR